MDNLDLKTPVQGDTNDLRSQVDQLRQLIASVLILAIVISGTLGIYLLRQWQSSRKDLAAIRPQAAQMINEYQKVSGPMMSDFVKKITDYGRTHPDFTPVLTKYGLKPVGPTSAPSAALGLPPAAAPKK
ncbi:MAG: hypothetical protein NT167_14620 [Verrucomicrobia bacterium]|nr:hypothetical protein [Verrucomicrobiota bacterium]